MKIAVLIKHVPDTETKIKLSASGTGIEEADFKYMVNPYDEFAIEEAVRTQEKFPGESIVICLGPTRAQEAMRKALAMGIDRGVWINSDSHHLDSFQVSSAIAKVLSDEKPDVVFCGQKAIDDDCGHIGPMVAELANMGHVQVVTKIEWKDNGAKAIVEREVEGGMVEVYDVMLPCVLGAHKSLNEPRFPSLPGIMKAKKKVIAEFNFDTLVQAKSLVSIQKYTLPAEKAPGKIFKGEAVEAMVQKVVGLLRTESKIL